MATYPGTNGDDIYTGGDEADTISGQAGNDTLNGGAGADLIDGGAGADNLHGGADNDNLRDGQDGDPNVVNNLYGEDGDDSLAFYGYDGTGAYNGITLLDGGAGNDILTASYTAGVLSGGIGNDTINGSVGTLALDGGDGTDIIHLGTTFYKSNDGIQTATGGTGADQFWLYSASNGVQRDRITDFNAAEGDRLHLFNVTNGRSSGGWWPIQSDLIFRGAMDPSLFSLGASLPGSDLGTGAIQVWFTHFGGNTFLIADSDGDLIFDDEDFVVQLDGDLTLTMADFAVGTFSAIGLTTAPDAYDGTDLADRIFGVAGDDVIDGRGGNDEISGGLGSDTLRGGDGNDVLRGEAGNDALNGDSGNDRLEGGDGDDLLAGGIGDDYLGGGDGNDTASYASASMRVTVNLGSALQQNTTGSGLDTLISIENLVGSALNDTLTGDDSANIIDGGLGNDVLDGAGGTDTLSYASVTSGGVTVSLATTAQQNTGSAGLDTVAGFENLTGTAHSDVLTGDAGENILTGGAGNDTLDGGAGNDVMYGGLGNDSFRVDTGLDRAIEASGQGDDTVLTSVTFALEAGSSIENLRVLNAASTGAINLTGNELAQGIYGNEGVNFLNGGGGNDYLVGGGGDDRLDGGTGSDNLAGGLGNDIYYTDVVGDRIIELLGQGDDTAFAAGSFVLEAGSELEALRIVNDAGTAAINLTGNEFGQTLGGNNGVNVLQGGGGNDYLVGGGGNDILDGGTGNDNMAGGTGNDNYRVDGIGDRVIEAVGQGDDTVLALGSVSLEAGSEVEALRAFDPSGTSAINLTGNEFGQTLAGNAGANVLSGGGGNDFLQGYGGNDVLDGGTGDDNMAGGTGNDSYLVDSANDRAIEAAGQGDDTVLTTVSYALEAGSEIEALRVRDAASTSAINLTGNEFGQSLYGNAGANVLLGGGGNDLLSGDAGNDSLNGGSGNDYLTGGAGADMFVWTDLGGTDRISDFASGSDKIDLSGLDAISGTSGDQAFTFIGASAFGNVAGQLRSYVDGGITYVAGDTDGNGTADFLINLGTAQVAAGDFVF